MIRITQQDSAKDAKRYYATADYYSEGQELIGEWGGKGAERLGLAGVVDKQSFERLCDNQHPSTGQPLTVRTRSERTVGYDFTFSVPKSVSLLYALHGDQEILDAFREAVDETMREIEAEMKTRVRKDGQDSNRTTGNMVWAEFVHTTSRPVDGVPDPHLHAHVFAFNTTWDLVEQRWKAGQFREIKRDAPYFQAAFRVRLANKLQDLGYGIERKRDDFEIAGIARDVLGRFSRRTTQIEKLAEDLGILDPNRKAELGATTREKKGKPLAWDVLRGEWSTRLAEGEAAALAAVHRREASVKRAMHGEGMAVDHAVAHAFERDAVVPERKLMTEALKRGLGAVSVDDVRRELDGRELIRRQSDGRAMATTPDMLAMESRLIAFARQGRGTRRPLGDPDRSFSRDWFNDGQKAAVRHVLGSRDRVMIVRGVAGSGKTTLEQEIGEAMAERGVPVVALAQSTKASRDVLRQEAGFAQADTVARFLKDQKLQEAGRGGLLLIDEASQLGTRDMVQLFDAADRLDARLLLVGDRRQHRAVGAGEPLKLLETEAGLRVAEVTDILRQKAEYKSAARALSEGKTVQAFETLDRLGWIRELPDGDRYAALADAYIEAAAQRKADGRAKTALVVSPTHSEILRTTHAIRAGLKARGKLGEDRIVVAWTAKNLTEPQKADAAQYDPGDMIQFHQNAPGYAKGARIQLDEDLAVPARLAARFEAYRPTPLPLAVGDRIRMTAGGKTKDGKHRLVNGTSHVVEGFTRGGDIVIDHGWVIDKNWGHFTHGYAQTSHSSQGATVDKVIVALSSESFPATGQRTAYVAITRGKEQALIYTDDKQELLNAIGRADSPMSATELTAEPKPNARLKRGMAFARTISAFFARGDDLDRRRREPDIEREIEHGR